MFALFISIDLNVTLCLCSALLNNLVSETPKELDLDQPPLPPVFNENPKVSTLFLYLYKNFHTGVKLLKH